MLLQGLRDRGRAQPWCPGLPSRSPPCRLVVAHRSWVLGRDSLASAHPVPFCRPWKDLWPQCLLIGLFTAELWSLILPN